MPAARASHPVRPSDDNGQKSPRVTALAARPVAARRAHPRRLPGREEPAALTSLNGPTARLIVT